MRRADSLGIGHGEASAWTRKMFGAALLLTAGSVSLLFGSFSLSLFGVFGLLVLPVFEVFGVILHLVAWLSLGLALRDASDEEIVGRVARVRAMKWAFRASILGFSVGLLLTPPLLFGQEGVDIIGSSVLPYFPTVFGPVVIAHAALFRFAAVNVRSRRAAAIMRGGAASLVVVAVTGVAVLILVLTGVISPSFFGFVLFVSPAGYTCIGYGMVSLAWGEAFVET